MLLWHLLYQTPRFSYSKAMTATDSIYTALLRTSVYGREEEEERRRWPQWINLISTCLQAHALYNSIICRAPSSPHWPKRLFEIQEIYYNAKSGNVTTLEKQHEITENLSTKLKEVRERYKSRMEQTVPTLLKSDHTPDVHSQGVFTASIRAISQECTSDMIHFAKEIIQYSLDALQEPPPCDFSVLAIGSMARGEATPYSDL